MKSWHSVWVFQSTPPARGATFKSGVPFGEIGISIHAPREGGDRIIWYNGIRTAISIHAPREGGDYSGKN